MADRTKNLLKALFFLVFALGCGAIVLAGNSGKTYPIIGLIIGGAAAIGFFRNAFRQ